MLAAPLKQYAQAFGQPPRRDFREHMLAAPLKPCPPRKTWQARARNFREHMLAAPLKRHATIHKPTLGSHFREHMLAAPLKRCWGTHRLQNSRIFPRAHARGPIEAR